MVKKRNGRKRADTAVPAGSGEQDPILAAIHAFESVPAAYLILDNRGRIAYGNRTAAVLLGQEQSLLAYRPFIEFIHPADVSAVSAFIGSLFENGTGGVIEASLAPAGPSAARVRIEGGVTRDAAGVAERCHLVISNRFVTSDAEERLRHSESLLRLALRNTPVSIAAQDRDLRFTYAYNQRTVKPETIIGKTDSEIFEPAVAERLMAVKRKVLETGVIAHEEFWITINEKTIYLDLYVEPIRDKDGSVSGIGIATVNLTRMKTIEELLKKNERLLAEAQRIARIGSWEWNIVTDTIRCSDELCIIMGFTHQSAPIDTGRFLALVHPDDLAEARSALESAKQKGTRINIDYRIVTTDGLIRIVHNEGEAVAFDASDRPISVVGTLQDITDRVHNDRVLRLTRERSELLAEIVNKASQPFCIGFPDGRLGDFNRAFAELTGYETGELRTLSWTETLTPPEWRELERGKLAEMTGTDAAIRYEKELLRRDGTRLPIELLVHLKVDAAGRPEYYYSFITDISERKRTDEKIRRHMEAVQEANEELHRFNRAMVDREIRMIELKKEVNRLSALLGLEAPYSDEPDEAPTT